MTLRFSDKVKSVSPFVYAHELDRLFEKFTDKYQVLSLDCFDTLLWRNVGQPKDVFFQLEKTDIGRQVALSAKLRAQAEKTLREEKFLLGQSTEIHLADIYRTAFPKAEGAVIRQLVEAELLTELEHCYIYKPSLDLLFEAKRRGMTTMIVSDIYMSADELRELIVGALKKIGVDLPIDYFFTSCDHKISKSEGLIKTAAQKIGIHPQNVIHLGDNEKADVVGAVMAGATGVLLRQYENSTAEMIRNTRLSTTLLDPDVRWRKPLSDSWSGIWALEPEPQNAMTVLGRYSLGPVVTNYCHWLSQEIKNVKQAGGKPRVVFMLRDGFILSEAFKIYRAFDRDLDDVPCSELETSRFIGYACSLVSKEKIRDYLQFLLATGQPLVSMALKQMLFDAEETKRISSHYGDGIEEFRRFMKDVTRHPYLDQIIERTKHFRSRFLKRISKIVDPQPGETLIFADLGYAGTIQTLIQPFVEEEYSVNVLGRYLILQDTINKDCKQGLICEKNQDLRAVNLLLKHITVLEQLCSNNLPSTIDFDADGEPVYSLQVIDDEQQKSRSQIQGEALAIVRVAAPKCQREKFRDIQSETLGLLGRMLLFPSWSEVQFFSPLVHDVNLGTNHSEKLTNLVKRKTEMLRSGILSAKNNQRNSIPHELRAMGMESLLFYNTANRFGLDFRAADFQCFDENFPIGVFSKEGLKKYSMTVYGASNGYKTVHIPISLTAESVCLFFGCEHSWFEIFGCTLSGETDFHSSAIGSRDFPASQIFYEGMKEHAKGLYEATSPSALIMLYTKDLVRKQGQPMVSVTFRPIRPRE